MASSKPAAKRVSLTEAQAALARVSDAMHAQFSTNTARLNQLDSHMATVAMVVDHLFDEADREAAG